MENPADKEPARVSLFGNVVDSDKKASWAERHEARHKAREERREARRRKGGGGHIVGGVILLLVGILLIGGTFGVVSGDVWRPIGQFWPLLLILLGLQVILGRSTWARVFMLIITLAALLFVFTYALMTTGSPWAQYIPLSVQTLIQSMPSPSSL